MARNSKYTDELVTKLCQAIELGATYELACNYAGITFETFRQWREKKPEFAARVHEAEGKATVKWLAKIEQAATDGAWQAAAWKLERRYPHSYGRQVQELQHSGTVGIAVTEIEVMLTPEKSES